MPRLSFRLTKCSICGQPALVGGRLCAACRAALKRARDTTVSEGIPSPRTPRKLPVLRSATRDAPFPLPAAGSRRRGPRLSWAIGAACVVAAGIVWFIHSHDEAGASATRLTEVESAEAIEAPLALAPLPAIVPEPARPQPHVAREPLDPRSMPSSIAVPRPAAKPPAVVPAEPPAVVVPEPGPPPLPAPVVVASAPPPRAAPDRWQVLADRIEQCQGNMFTRVVCQESLRLEHCEGYWGRVPPCPAKVEREHGN